LLRHALGEEEKEQDYFNSGLETGFGRCKHELITQQVMCPAGLKKENM
jgi:hypothetical protein